MSNETAIAEIKRRSLFDTSLYSELLDARFDNYDQALEHYLLNGHVNLAAPNCLFSPPHYLARSPEALEKGENPLLHYLNVGVREERSPHALYDPKFIARQLPRGNSVPSIFEFVLSATHRDVAPHPLFDPIFYREENATVPFGRDHPLVHFLQFGVFVGLQPHRLFEPNWYSRVYPDIPVDSALLHFLTFGGQELREPSPLFSAKWYVARYTDVNPERINPLLHYLTQGSAEGRQPHMLFDPEFYEAQVSSTGEKARSYLDYLASREKNVRPHPVFNASWYLGRDTGLARYHASMLDHFLRFGLVEGSTCDPYGSFIPAEFAEAGELDLANVIWGQQQLYVHRRNVDIDLIGRAILDLPELGLEASALQEAIENTLAVKEIDFNDDIQETVTAIVKDAVRFESLLVLFTPLEPERLREALRIVFSHQSKNSPKDQGVLLVTVDPLPVHIPASIAELVHVHPIAGPRIRSNPNYLFETLKSVLMSVCFDSIYLVADEHGLEFAHKFRPQLESLHAAHCVVLDGYGSSAAIAALAELVGTSTHPIGVISSDPNPMRGGRGWAARQRGSSGNRSQEPGQRGSNPEAD